MLPFLKSKKKESVIGLDIGSANIRMIHLREKARQSFAVVAFGVLPISPETIVEGAIIDPSAVVDTIQHLRTQLQVKERRVAFSMSGNAVFVKTLKVASSPDPLEMRESIMWEAEQFLPFPRDEVMLDYHVVGDPARDMQVDVVVVALKRDAAQVYLDAIQQAGFEPVVLDVEAFAMQNAFELNYPEEAGSDRLIMLAQVGASKTNINIIRGGHPLLVRDVMVGARALTDMLRTEFNLTYDQAELAKRGRYEIRMEQIQPYVNQVIQDICREIQKTFRFFTNSFGEIALSKVYLCGGGANLPGLDDALSGILKCQVEKMDPFRVLDYSAVDPNLIEDYRYASAVAVGLGIRKV